MKVLYDYQAFEMQTHGGVSRCFAEIYSHMPNDITATIGIKGTNNEYLLSKGFKYWGPSYNRFLSSFPFSHDCLPFSIYEKLISKYCQKRIARNHKYCKHLLSNGKIDIFHPTYFDDWFLECIGEIPFVLTIHDMIPELYPQFFNCDDKQIVMKRKLAPLARKIIAVSENTKNDIINLLGITGKNIEVVYHGATDLNYTYTKESPFSLPYILYVGKRFGYKNFTLFLKSFANITKYINKLLLVCIGKPFDHDENNLIELLGVKDKTISIYVKKDYDLMNLYHHALCFVYPSEYEGFGIPILEAFQADCPVLLNKKSCFPEIAGDAALYFTMDNEHNNFDKIFLDFYKNYNDIRSHLLQKQRARLNYYSWRKTSAKLAEIYKSIIS